MKEAGVREEILGAVNPIDEETTQITQRIAFSGLELVQIGASLLLEDKNPLGQAISEIDGVVAILPDVWVGATTLF